MMWMMARCVACMAQRLFPGALAARNFTGTQGPFLVQETEAGLGPSPSVALPEERQPPAAMQAVSVGDGFQDDGGSTSDGISTSDADDELDSEVEVSV